MEDARWVRVWLLSPVNGSVYKYIYIYTAYIEATCSRKEKREKRLKKKHAPTKIIQSELVVDRTQTEHDMHKLKEKNNIHLHQVIYIKWWTKTSTSPWVLVAYIYLKYDPGQITLFRQPRFPCKKGISLTICYLLGAQVVFPVAIFLTRKMPPLHPRNPRQHGSFASFREPRWWLQGSPSIYIRGVIFFDTKTPNNAWVF